MKLYNFTSISSIVSNILLIIQFRHPQDLSGACVLRSVCTRCISPVKSNTTGLPSSAKKTLPWNKMKKKKN